MTAIAIYITGHGFGHAVRSYQVIRALKKAVPAWKIHVRTTAPEWLFQDPSASIVYHQTKIDIGIVQKDSLAMDLTETLRSCRDLYERASFLIESELAFVRQHRIALIVSDTPALAFEVAARAMIPSVAVTNFTWSWIYRAYLKRYPGFLPLIEEMENFYHKATLAMTLPYACDLSIFSSRQAIPWITRTSSLSKHQARASFALPQSATLVLLSFGGLGLERLPWQTLQRLRDYYFVGTDNKPRRDGNICVLPEMQREYCDLVRAADVIVAKPGYGIVADILAHQTPVLYVERHDFPEFPYLARALNQLTTAEFLPLNELLSGRIEPPLIRVLKRERHWPAVPLNGAQMAAEKIIALAASS